MTRLRRHFLWIAFALSVLVHFAPVTGPKLWSSIVSWFRPGSVPATALDESKPKKGRRSAEEIQAARRTLVDGAIAERKTGKLVLGRFLLDADALDAEEEGDELDSEHARRLYDERKQKLRRALAEHAMPEAIEDAFEDLAYSTAVNRMSNMLLTKVGACGPTAQLMAATAYDLGERDQLRLRHWGGVNKDGATHLAATWKLRGVNIDLATGAPAFRGGSELRADELIEAYARAHGLLPPLPGPAGGTPDVDATARSSFLYPPNADVYEVGEIPLFAEARKKGPAPRLAGRSAGAQGIPAGAEGGSLPLPADDELWRSMSWPMFGGTAREEEAGVCVLDPRARAPRSVAIIAESGAVSIQVIPVLSDASLAYVARSIAGYERLSPKKTESEKVLRDACLGVSYHWAAERFVAAGYDVIGNEAARRGDRHREEAEKRLAALEKLHKDRLSKPFEAISDQWALIALDPGQNVLLEIETKRPMAAGKEISPYWSQDRRTRALLLEPKTRVRLFEAAPKLSLEYRMHLIGAIASLELSGVDLDLPKDGFIGKAYAAYTAFIEAMRRSTFEPVRSFDEILEVLKAVGATDAEIAEKKREIDRIKQQMEQNKLRFGPVKR